MHRSAISNNLLSLSDRDLVARLRLGDEEAYGALIDRYYSAMLHVALGFVPSRSVAEDVVQDTWLAVVTGVDRFEQRCSFKTWLFRILVNRARSRGVREHRYVAFSSLEDDDPGRGWSPEDVPGEAIGATRIARPDDALLNDELSSVMSTAIERLPGRQRQVLVLRDVEGWSAAEVCELLEVSEANQRVLLHRARVAIRAIVAPYLAGRQPSRLIAAAAS
jgi:RNA polymerase sigma-70 factor, ECF subfamily